MEEGSDAPFSKNFVVSSPIIHNHSAEMQQDTSHPLQSVKPTDPILNSFFMNAHATNITNSTSDTSSTYDLQRPSSSLQEEIPYQNTRFCISLPSRINVIERGPSCIHLLPPPCQSSWWHQLQTKFKLIPWFIWLYGITFLLLSSLFIFNYKLLLIWIHTLSTKLVEMHILGLLLCMGFTILTAFPFTIGYGLSIFLIGSTYRMPWSIVIAYTATLLGAMLSFILCRSFLQDYMHRIMSRSEHFAFASHVMKKHPVKFLIVLRLAPVPYNLLNLVCAGLPTISLRHFMLALCVVTSRVVLTLYIAGTLSDIASHEANHGSHVSPAKWIELGISIALFMLFILASSRFYNIMRRKWEQQQSQEDQEQQHQGMQEEQLEGSRMAWHDMEALSGSLLDIPSIQTLQS